MTIYFAYIVHGKDPVNCDACEAHAPLFPFRQHASSYGPIGVQIALLCNLCASTAAGNAYKYPYQYRDQASVLFANSFTANAILTELGTFKDVISLAFTDGAYEHLLNPELSRDVWKEFGGDA